MKKLNLIISLLSIFNFYSQNIEGKITYIATADNALYYNEKEGITPTNTLKELYKKATNIKSVLKFNSKLSEYFIIDKLDVSRKKNFNLTYLTAGHDKKFYTYNSTMKYENKTLNCDLLDECILIQNQIPKWELVQKTKEIGGFLCYNAIITNPKTGKKKIEVWYAPSIPYQYGIMNFYGLPGVILEMNIRSILITAIKIELNPLENVEINPPKTAKELTNKEFEELQKKSFPEFFKN